MQSSSSNRRQTECSVRPELELHDQMFGTGQEDGHVIQKTSSDA